MMQTCGSLVRGAVVWCLILLFCRDLREGSPMDGVEYYMVAQRERGREVDRGGNWG